jgi:hypothetical protein
MKAPLFGMLCAVTMALISISSPSVAQQNTGIIQNTVKECLDHWRANKAKSQAQGITRRDYVAQCRDGFVPTPAVTLAAVPTTTPDTAKTVTGRPLRKRLHSAAPVSARGPRKAMARRSLREPPRLRSAAPSTAVGKTKAVTGTPADAGEHEGSVDW